MAEYRFVTFWHIQAPLQAVFDAVLESRQWPQWWRGAQEVRELEAGDSQGIGSIRRYVWRSPTLYRVRFDARAESIERPYRIRASVSGDLAGSGHWHFSHDRQITTVRYEWHVRTTRKWMNMLAAVLRFPFAVNHRILMRRGAHGLAERLQAPLLAELSVEYGAGSNYGWAPLPSCSLSPAALPPPASHSQPSDQLSPSESSGNRHASMI